jgi:hypothetical protein
MTIREAIARLQPGDPPVAASDRWVVNYIRLIACENGQRLKQAKQANGSYLIWCIGEYKDATRAWLKRQRRRRRHQAKWRKKHSEKYDYRQYIKKLYGAGVLVKQPCEVCGYEPAEAHHSDYSKPDEVRWLCRKHHIKIHRALYHKLV